MLHFVICKPGISRYKYFPFHFIIWLRSSIKLSLIPLNYPIHSNHSSNQMRSIQVRSFHSKKKSKAFPFKTDSFTQYYLCGPVTSILIMSIFVLFHPIRSISLQYHAVEENPLALFKLVPCQSHPI